MNNANQPVNPVKTPAQFTSNPINNRKGNLPIILGVLVLLLVVGGGAYYFGTQSNLYTFQAKLPTSPHSNIENISLTSTPNQAMDDTSKWVIYKNAALGLTFKYPNDYKLVNNLFYPSELAEDMYIENSKVGAVLISDKAKQSGICNYADESKSTAKVLSRETKFVSDIEGIKEVIETLYLGDNGEGYGNLYVTNFCTIKGEKTITVSFYTYNDPPTISEQNIFDEIYSTISTNN